ncbi:MAG: hypothetical protein AAF604_18670 [Acidobacteriota bacterium]
MRRRWLVLALVAGLVGGEGFASAAGEPAAAPRSADGGADQTEQEPPESEAPAGDEAELSEYEPVDLAAVAADREGLEGIYRQQKIVARAEEPGAADYLSYAIKTWFETLTRRVVLPSLAPKTVLVLIASVVIASALTVFAWFLLALVGQRRPRRRATLAGPLVGEPADGPLDATAWWRIFGQRLRSGDADAALEALWWWLARSLAGSEADPSWTGRELLRRAERLDLRDSVGRLDRLRYGPEGAALGEVERLASRLEASLS